MILRTFKLKRPSEYNWPNSCLQVGKLRLGEKEGLATGQAWWSEKNTKLGVRRLGFESWLCHQVLGNYGQVLSSLWVQSAVVSGWGLGSQGYLAGQRTERGSMQTFTSPEHVFLVVI